MTDWSGTLPDFYAGLIPDGDDFDTVRDALASVSDAWGAYAPAWTSSGTQPALGNGSLTGFYRRTGKQVEARISLIMGTTTTYGTGLWMLSLPVTATTTNQCGVCLLKDTGTADKAGMVYMQSTTTVTPVSSTAVVTATSPHTWASTDQVQVYISYEAA